MQIHANIALNKQHMHFLLTCFVYVFLYVFACIFVCMCMYVCCIFVIFVYMCAYCLYVVHIDRLTNLPAKNTGTYMQYSTDSNNIHNIHPHTCTYIHKKCPTYMQIHTHTYKYGLKYVPVCCMYDPF